MRQGTCAQSSIDCSATIASVSFPRLVALPSLPSCRCQPLPGITRGTLLLRQSCQRGASGLVACSSYRPPRRAARWLLRSDHSFADVLGALSPPGSGSEVVSQHHTRDPVSRALFWAEPLTSRGLLSFNDGYVSVRLHSPAHPASRLGRSRSDVPGVSPCFTD